MKEFNVSDDHPVVTREYKRPRELVIQLEPAALGHYQRQVFLGLASRDLPEVMMPDLDTYLTGHGYWEADIDRMSLGLLEAVTNAGRYAPVGSPVLTTLQSFPLGPKRLVVGSVLSLLPPLLPSHLPEPAEVDHWMDHLDATHGRGYGLMRDSSDAMKSIEVPGSLLEVTLVWICRSTHDTP